MRKGPPPRERLVAEAIIRRMLADGPARCGDVTAAIRAAGISKQTAWRARREVGVERWADPRPGPRSVWWMRLQ